MLGFTSFEFLVFFAAVTALFYAVPLKVRPFYLLLASILYYFLASRIALVYLLVVIAFTYFAGKQIEKNKNRILLFVSIGIIVAFLIGFKTINAHPYRIGSLLGLSFESFIMPLGISFFTFRAISYLVDIYRGKIENVKFTDYALYISFFPHIVSGPIARFEQFNNDLKTITTKRFSYEKLRSGLILILWGFFMKLVIADRLAIFVNTVLGNYQVYGSTEIILAVMMYAIEIYCDFAGYSNIANGCAMTLGFEPVINFLSPYFSKSFKEFWRRWHVSLSSWFKDYLYIPLGGNRKSKTRTYINIVIVMLVSGIWHGIGTGFIAWGLLHGLLQVLENIIHKKKEIDNRFSSKLLHTMGMFLLLCITWIFFYSDGIKEALMIIRQCFISFNPWVLFDGSIFNCGLEASEWNIVIVSIIALTAFDYISYKTDKRFDEIITSEMTWFYWLILIVLFSAVWILGIYGPYFSSSSFIYASF